MGDKPARVYKSPHALIISLTLVTAATAETTRLTCSLKPSIQRSLRPPLLVLQQRLVSPLLLRLGGVRVGVRDGLHSSGPVQQDCLQHEEEAEGSGNPEVGVSFRLV